MRERETKVCRSQRCSGKRTLTAVLDWPIRMESGQVAFKNIYATNFSVCHCPRSSNRVKMELFMINPYSKSIHTFTDAIHHPEDTAEAPRPRVWGRSRN